MYGLWLANIPGITQFKIRLIREVCPVAEELYAMSDETIAKIPRLEKADVCRIIESRKNWNPEREWMKLQEKGIHFVTLEDAVYPEKLKSIHNPPYALYYMGKLPDPEAKSVAIVGARGRSAYGSQVARQLAEALAHAGIAVVSGMARGIDTDGHMGALEAHGETFAVLGCGVDICYPKQNDYLYRHIPENGGILSEYPLGTEPMAALFPQRNRIISGLSDYTVVIEARTRSGSLITADYAMEQGREVYALPGRITDPLSQGTNALIRQGAGIYTGVEDFLKDLQFLDANSYVQSDFRKNLLEKDESLVYSLFDFAPVGLGSLIQNSPYGLSEIMNILERLEQKGFVKETIPNYYVKTI